MCNINFLFLVNMSWNSSTEPESFECFSSNNPCDTDHPSLACTHRIGSIAANAPYDVISGKQNISVSLCTKPFDPQDRFTTYPGHFWEVSFSNLNNSGYMKGVYDLTIPLFEILYKLWTFQNLSLFK